MNGVALVAASAVGLAAAHLMIKALGAELPYYWVAFVRNAAPLPLLALAMSGGGVPFGSPNRTGLLLRGVWGALAIGCLCWALPRMPLADAILLAHASPLWAALWGVCFLGERLERAAVACLAVAFLGVFVTLRPALAFDSWPYAVALASGLFSSFAHVAVKSLTRTEHVLRIVFYAALAGSAWFLPQVLASPVRPSAGQWSAMAAIGVVVTVSQLLLTEGISRSPVSRASAAILLTIVFNLAGGRLLWGESPDAWGWVGCALISGGIFALGAQSKYSEQSSTAKKDSGLAKSACRSDSALADMAGPTELASTRRISAG
ncbi:MAG: DMT family transporter [Elusimicrobia bacterium]|nr:DMT family transporter [Elusimicrobiota bacterium]